MNKLFTNDHAVGEGSPASKHNVQTLQRLLAEERATTALELLNLVFEFIFSRLKVGGHASETHHSFDLPMNNLLVQADFIF